MNHINPT